MSRTPEDRNFDSKAALTAALAQFTVDHLSAAVAARGRASIVLSGGSTPAALYDTLAGMSAPWDRVTACPSDERWVAENDPLSNARMIRQHLIRDRAAHVRYVSLKTAEAEPELAEPAVDAAVRAIARPFDLLMLGMGEDGHTASLFPKAQGLSAGLDLNDPALARAVRPASSDPKAPPRISLTLRALLDSRLIILLIEGEKKRAVYQQAMAGSDIPEMPVRAILRQDKTPVQVWWAP